MATTEGDPIFVDTNVLVYSTRPFAARHAAATAAVARLAAAGAILWISPQILREYLAVVTRPQATAPGLPMATALNDVQRCCPASSRRYSHRGLGARRRDGPKGCRPSDRRHLAVLRQRGTPCGTVHRRLTFNGADFQRFAPLIEIDALP